MKTDQVYKILDLWADVISNYVPAYGKKQTYWKRARACVTVYNGEVILKMIPTYGGQAFHRNISLDEPDVLNVLHNALMSLRRQV